MSNPEFTAPDYTSQTASTYKANIDASIAANGNDYINLGLTYSAGTLTITDARGGALSASNPGFVRFQDPDAPGLSKYISVEANQAFIDDAGSSEIIGNLFGFTTGDTVDQDVPFFIYAVSNDNMDAVAFMISRVPGMTQSPVAASIGAPDDAVADDDFSFFSFDSLDEAVYDSNPCVMVGSFRMRMSSSDDWTVQTLSVDDGIGQFHEATTFDMPTGVMGAASGGHLKDNGGTAPAFSTNEVKYRITKGGQCTVLINLSGDGGTDGAGTVNTELIVPFDAENDTYYAGHVQIQDPVGIEGHICQLNASANEVQFPSTIDGGNHKLDEFSNGSRFIKGQLTFMIAKS